jgi:hypothetical protein
MICEPIRAIRAVEYSCQPWKQIRWRFLTRQQLSFQWWFLSPRGCLRCRIHASPVKAVSLMISESAGAVSIVELTCQPWKQFRGCFLSVQGLSFQWWFLSPQLLSFRLWFLSPQELYPLSNPLLNCASSFVDVFWVGSDSVFNDDFSVHKGCTRCRILVSTVEADSLTISH